LWLLVVALEALWLTLVLLYFQAVAVLAAG
jgi:hypothetical protein